MKKLVFIILSFMTVLFARELSIGEVLPIGFPFFSFQQLI